MRGSRRGARAAQSMGPARRCLHLPLHLCFQSVWRATRACRSADLAVSRRGQGGQLLGHRQRQIPPAGPVPRLRTTTPPRGGSGLAGFRPRVGPASTPRPRVPGPRQTPPARVGARQTRPGSRRDQSDGRRGRRRPATGSSTRPPPIRDLAEHFDSHAASFRSRPGPGGETGPAPEQRRCHGVALIGIQARVMNCDRRRERGGGHPVGEQLAEKQSSRVARFGSSDGALAGSSRPRMVGRRCARQRGPTTGRRPGGSANRPLPWRALRVGSSRSLGGAILAAGHRRARRNLAGIVGPVTPADRRSGHLHLRGGSRRRVVGRV